LLKIRRFLISRNNKGMPGYCAHAVQISEFAVKLLIADMGI
jgi:hypothetical protein